ncbi:DEAD/DEAH box helicase [Natronorubrum thiooxidans]|uniref:Superfamily II DNA or RNA helicase n=1 Tax=Natronorubrum thiooxidans TaxID=308853 RepID=A0A1N7GUA6_9EURY|nr:DEAD/DEAH box helicase family protein [Natronorubrum thiooxidans]SIS16187.1 Superfamily II DNA or RNA helicase [Natronorubrum thiooxidans]
MGKGIDRLVDKQTGQHVSPGESFQEIFLSKYPTSQWPSFIDEIAIDLSADIRIGDTELSQYNFPREAGPFYRQGMIAAAGSNGDIESVLDKTVDAADLGTIVYQLNQLSYQIEQSDTGLENVQHAIEAVIEKLLTKETGVDLSSQHHRDTGTIADIVMDLFSHNEVARHAETLVDEFEDSLGQGLLARLDEPQMMMPLWDHQLDALQAWRDADYRGYADMATATGKTVLGLAAIALRYGSLHPYDDLSGRTGSRSHDRILIVAHSDLILEQWRREFDSHLNIPEERTQGSDTIDLSWGEIHFRTPQSLINQSHYPYDLVVLDEAHHYATGRGWGDLLDHFDENIIALSGSVDDRGSDSDVLQDRLENKVGRRIKRYDIESAQEDGIIPAFDWEVRYAQFEHDEDFVTLSQSVDEHFDAFKKQVAANEIDTERRLQTFDDVRTFSHTTAGKELKRSDEDFRAFSTALFSRRMKRWNLSPQFDVMVEVVADHTNDHVVVLVDSNAQVEALTDRLRDELSITTVQAATSDQPRATLRDRLDEFNDAESGGVVVGTGDLLGEGVDIPQANVAVNMATGGVNAQLVQRIGRVLRNPMGDKHAHFYNVLGVPDANAAIPSQDGRRLIEHAGEFCALGARFNNLPGFATASDLDNGVLSELLAAGADSINELQKNGVYDLPDDRAEAEHLQGLLDTVWEVNSNEIQTVLGEWSEYTWYESAQSKQGPVSDKPTKTTEVTVTAPDDRVLVDAALSVSTESDADVTVADTDEQPWCVTAPHGTVLAITATHPDFASENQRFTVGKTETSPELILTPRATPDGVTIVAANHDDRDRCVLNVVDGDASPVGGAAISVTSTETAGFFRTQSDGRVTISRAQFDDPVRIAVRHVDVGIRVANLALPTHSDLQITLPDERYKSRDHRDHISNKG